MSEQSVFLLLLYTSTSILYVVVCLLRTSSSIFEIFISSFPCVPLLLIFLLLLLMAYSSVSYHGPVHAAIRGRFLFLSSRLLNFTIPQEKASSLISRRYLAQTFYSRYLNQFLYNIPFVIFKFCRFSVVCDTDQALFADTFGYF